MPAPEAQVAVGQAVLGAAAVAASAFSLGRALLRETSVYAYGVGAAALSLLLWAAAVAGLARPPVLAAIGLLALLSSVRQPWPALPKPRWAWTIFVPFVLLYLSHALGVETEPDAAGYHLGLAAQILREGRLPAEVGFYEVLPLGMELLYGLASLGGGYPAARLLHLSFLLATVPAMLRIGGSIPAAAIYLAVPAAAMSATSAYTDAVQVFALLCGFGLLREGRPFAAGCCAGLAYTAKVSSLVAIPGVLLWLFAGKQWRLARRFAAGSALLVMPWMIRAWWMSGNPLAPMANHWFPNDSFHPLTGDWFGHSVRGGLESFWQRPWAVAVDGGALQGLLGPVFLILPLVALSAVRTSQGRALLAAAAVLLVPWLLNPGARFALPSAAFVCLAAASALPPRPLWSLAALHLTLSLPPVMDLYTNPHAWRLRGWRHETPLDYFAPVQLLRQHVKPGERVLDLVGLPRAYLDLPLVGPYSSNQVDQWVDALLQGSGRPERLFALRAEWPLEFLRALRVRAGSPPASIPWVVTEITPLRGASPVSPLRNWFVEAWPEPAGAPLAADANFASRWQSWRPAPAGAFVEVRFDRPVPLDGMEVALPNYEPRQDITLWMQDLSGVWRHAEYAAGALPLRPKRRDAIALLRTHGIRWIYAEDGRDSFGVIGAALRMAPEAWGVETAGRVDNYWLFRVR
jgi:hypothetical protein